MLSPSEQSSTVLNIPRLGREGFVAETAVRLDRLQVTVQRLEREAEVARGVLGDLAESSDQTKRFRAFEETMRNARDYKIDELMRCIRDLKCRLELVEGDRAKLPGLKYNSIERVDRKLSELESLQEQLRASAVRVRVLSWVCGGATVALLASVLPGYFGF